MTRAFEAGDQTCKNHTQKENKRGTLREEEIPKH